MFGQLLDKLTAKAILSQADVQQMAAAATQALQDPSSSQAFDGIHDRYDDEPETA